MKITLKPITVHTYIQAVILGLYLAFLARDKDVTVTDILWLVVLILLTVHMLLEFHTKKEDEESFIIRFLVKFKLGRRILYPFIMIGLRKKISEIDSPLVRFPLEMKIAFDDNLKRIWIEKGILPNQQILRAWNRRMRQIEEGNFREIMNRRDVFAERSRERRMKEEEEQQWIAANKEFDKLIKANKDVPFLDRTNI